jgi:hypothetical protein
MGKTVEFKQLSELRGATPPPSRTAILKEPVADRFEPFLTLLAQADHPLDAFRGSFVYDELDDLTKKEVDEILEALTPLDRSARRRWVVDFCRVRSGPPRRSEDVQAQFFAGIFELLADRTSAVREPVTDLFTRASVALHQRQALAGFLPEAEALHKQMTYGQHPNEVTAYRVGIIHGLQALEHLIFGDQILALKRALRAGQEEDYFDGLAEEIAYELIGALDGESRQ